MSYFSMMVMTILIFDAVGTLSVLQVVFLLQRHTGYFLIQVTNTEHRCQNCEKKQLEKLEAAKSAYPWLPFVTFPGLTEPY